MRATFSLLPGDSRESPDYFLYFVNPLPRDAEQRLSGNEYQEVELCVSL